MTITEVLQLYPRTKAEKWKQHPNGEGWIHDDAKVSPEAFIGSRVAVRGGTIEGGTIRGGTIEGGTITDKAIVKIGEDYVTLLSVAEWGAITGHRTTDGWVIVCGCRRFTLAEAMDHWKGREDRTGTRVAVDVIAQIAKQRGWDLTADKESK